MERILLYKCVVQNLMNGKFTLYKPQFILSFLQIFFGPSHQRVQLIELLQSIHYRDVFNQKEVTACLFFSILKYSV